MDFCSLPKLVQPSRLKDTIHPDNDLIIIVDTYQIMSICQAQVVRNGPCYAMQWWIQMTFSTANVHISQVHILSFPMQTTYTLTFFCVFFMLPASNVRPWRLQSNNSLSLSLNDCKLCRFTTRQDPFLRDANAR